MVAPLVEELADEYGPKMKFVSKRDESFCRGYGIRSSTLIVFKGGQPVGQIIGFRPKNDLKRVIDQALAS
jgi:thioredoxin 1